MIYTVWEKEDTVKKTITFNLQKNIKTNALF